MNIINRSWKYTCLSLPTGVFALALTLIKEKWKKKKEKRREEKEEGKEKRKKNRLKMPKNHSENTKKVEKHSIRTDYAFILFINVNCRVN